MVTIMIKNPNGSDQDFSLEVPLADTAIADVKRMLHEKHPEHPEPSTQRLIFAGKLLVDESLTADVLKQVSSPLTHPHVLLRPSDASELLCGAARRHASADLPPHDAEEDRTTQPDGSACVLSSRGQPQHSPSTSAASSNVASSDACGRAGAGGAPRGSHRVGPSRCVGAFVPAGQPDRSECPPRHAAADDAAADDGLRRGAAGRARAADGGRPVLPACHARVGWAARCLNAASHARLRPRPFLAGWRNELRLGRDGRGCAGCGRSGRRASARGSGSRDGRWCGAAGGGGGGDFFDDDGEEAHTDSLKLLLKLALFVYILGQDGGMPRILVLSGAAVAIFLAQTGRLVFLQSIGAAILARQRAPAMAGGAPAPPAADAAPRADREAVTDAAGEGGQPATEADPPAQGDAAPPADDGAGAAADGNAPPPGLLRDLENVVVTFFTSLLPAWPAGEPAGQEVAAGGM